MRRLPALLIALAAAFPALADDTHPAPKKACLSASETREEIKARKLHEPFAALKSASQHFKAEALSAKLCRIDDELVYEIALLHKDGKYFHAHVSAVTGKLVEFKHATATPAPPPKT
jgi:uncharacterized membrane protein YkoI